MPRLVATQSPALCYQAPEHELELASSPRRRLFPANPASLYDVDIDTFSNFETHGPATANVASIGNLRTSLEGSPAAPSASDYPGRLTYIDLNELLREPSASTIDILLPSEPSSLPEGLDDDSDKSSVTLVRYRGLLREARSSLSPEPTTLPTGDLLVSRKRRSGIDLNQNGPQSNHENPAGRPKSNGNGEASTRFTSSASRTTAIRGHSRILSEVRNVSQTFKENGGSKPKAKTSPKKPQWNSPSQADFSPKENRARLAASPKSHSRSPAGKGIQGASTSPQYRSGKQKAGGRIANQVLEGSPSLRSGRDDTSTGEASMNSSMRNLERIAQWRNDCPFGVLDDSALQSSPIIEEAPRLPILDSIAPADTPIAYAKNDCVPFTLEESGILWVYCPSDVAVGIFEIEIVAKIIVSSETDNQWQSLQIPGLPLQDNILGHISFGIDKESAPAVEFDTAMLEDALVTGTSVQGDFSLQGPLWLLFRLKKRVYQIQDYQIRCDLQAMFDWTSMEGVWAMYKAAIELPEVPRDVFAERCSIVLVIKDGPKETAAYRLGTNERNKSIGLTPIRDGSSTVQLVVDWNHNNEDICIIDLCFDVFLGKPPRTIPIPTTSASAQGGKIEQGVRVMEPMKPLLMDFPIHLVPQSWEHRVLKSEVGRIHEFVRRCMPKTFPSDLEGGLRARISGLEAVVFSGLKGMEGAREGVQSMRVTLSEIQGALECELDMRFLVRENRVEREVISFIGVDWIPKIAFVNGLVAEEGQFFINKEGELALYRTENLPPGQLISLQVVWTLEKQDAELQIRSGDREDGEATTVEYDLPRVVGKSVLRTTLECCVRGASMVSYCPPDGEEVHWFGEGARSVRLPCLRPGYRLVVEKDVVFSNGEEHQWLLGADGEDGGKEESGSGAGGLGLERRRKNVRFAVDEEKEKEKAWGKRWKNTLLTALLTVLLLSLVAGGVDYLGFTGKRGGLRRGMGRGNGLLAYRGIGTTKGHDKSTRMETAIVEVPVAFEDEGHADASARERLIDGIEGGDDVLLGVRLGLAGNDATKDDSAAFGESKKQGLGFRDMIDYALGWRGERKK